MTQMKLGQMRRQAQAQGLAITTRGGGFMVIDPATNSVLAGGHPSAYSMNADEVADYLAEATA